MTASRNVTTPVRQDLAAGLPLLGPHRFKPHPRDPASSQCKLCYGWYDDPRHVTGGTR